MSDTSEIKRAIKQIAKGEDLLPSVVCIVDSVDLTAKTCYCIPVTGEADLLDVALIADPDKKGFMAVPKVGSTVYVKFKGKYSAFVAMTSEIDFLYLNGDNYSGLVKISDLVTKLNRLESDLNTLKAAFSAWVVVPNDGGAALKAITATWFANTITATTQAMLENTTVKHGNGT